MVNAIVLLNVERDKIISVGEKLAEIEGISEVYTVAGRYDLVAVVRVKDNEILTDIVAKHMLKIQGISKSETLIGLKIFSRHDLESMFNIGYENV